MKNKKYFKMLNDEFEQMTPEMSDKLKNTRLNVSAAKTLPEKHGIKKSPFVKIAAYACSFLLVATGVLAITGVFGGYVKYDTCYAVEISQTQAKSSDKTNITVIADEKGKVVKVSAEDRKGQILVSGSSSYSAENGAENVLSGIAQAALNAGYFSDGLMTVSVISSRGDKATKDAAENCQEYFEGEVENYVSVTQKDKSQFCQTYGLSADASLTEAFAAAAQKDGYLEGMLKKASEEGGDAFYDSYTVQLLNEYITLHEARSVACENVFATFEQAKTEAGLGLFDNLLENGKITEGVEVSVNTRQMLEKQLSDCMALGLDIKEDDDLYAAKAFYVLVSPEFVRFTAEVFIEAGAALADIVKGISDAIGVVSGEAQSYYQYVKTEWKNFYDDVKNQSVSGSEDFLQKMDTSFKNEFQTLCKAF